MKSKDSVVIALTKDHLGIDFVIYLIIWHLVYQMTSENSISFSQMLEVILVSLD